MGEEGVKELSSGSDLIAAKNFKELLDVKVNGVPGLIECDEVAGRLIGLLVGGIVKK